ncbi:trans-aconitate 2-methyltransferase [Nocardia sp. CC227C]|uniref:class I SAM-dependent methyltransferase n=1 Tax=Nocardia sp. CC227C TaxID=3044562 RepID=UPI00278BCB2C|nr:class I SAM-dependent methyltransferase [Nocardia sp. CC227C]
MAGTARFEWIVGIMGIRAEDRILEVGAGSSPSVAYLAAPLTTGRVVAIDRSATAIARSAKKHAALVESGRVRLLQVALEDLRPEDVRENGTGFDKILAVNVNLFWTRDPTPELATIRELLDPGGALYLMYGYGDPGADTASSPKPLPGRLSEHLRGAGFDIRTRASGDLLGIAATPV